MRDFSKVSPTIWRSKKFRGLSDMTSRHVYLYLITCPHGNSAGCFDLPPLYACNDLGIDEEAYKKAFDSLCEAGLIDWDEAEHTVWIVNWDEFNEPTNPKHAMGLLSQLDQASSHHLKSIAFHAFLGRFRAKTFDRDPALRKAIDIFLKAYPETIATETRDQRPETEIETEKKRESPSPTAAPPSDAKIIEAVRSAWNKLADETNLSKIQLFSAPRKTALRVGLASIGGLEGWFALCDKIRGSPFLLGENDRAWKVTFDWVLKPANLTKTMEGNYERTRKPKLRSTLESLRDCLPGADGGGDPGAGPPEAGHGIYPPDHP